MGVAVSYARVCEPSIDGVWTIKAIRRYGFTLPDGGTIYIWDKLLRGAAQRAGSENGLSLNLWFIHQSSIEYWLKFDRVSWPLYFIYDKQSDVEVLSRIFHSSTHSWGTRSFWNFEVNPLDRREIGSSTSQGLHLKMTTYRKDYVLMSLNI